MNLIKRIACFTLLFIIVNVVYAQKNREPVKSDFFISGTSDMLYWNDVFLIDRSPISTFQNYKQFYPKFPTFLLDVAYGTLGEQDKNYALAWYIEDSTLYLVDIYVPVLGKDKSEEDYYPKNKRYKIMEDMTGYRFNKKDVLAEADFHRSRLGAMKAEWVTGSFYIKKIRKIKDDQPDEWKEKPYLQISFDKGKLISVDTVQSKVQSALKKR